MDDKTAQPCRHAELVVALAEGGLSDESSREVVRHLERHEACREIYRRQTAGAFPQIPTYTILKEIDKGGFGVVYKAIHHAKERVEALKVLFSKTLLLADYFENEVHLVAKLEHPHIATLYEAQLSTPPLFYTMEYVDGERLNEHLERQTVSLARRIEIIRTVAAALEYAHGQGVIHRDIKPQNILIDAAGRPHIVDFGIGKRLGLIEADTEASDEGERSSEGAIGTVGYIAPEQIAGDEVDARADVFALGALLFYCVTGEPARLAGEVGHRLRALRNRHVGAPQDLSAIIGRCVEQSPAARYASCQALADDLANYLAGKPIAARASRSVFYRAARIGALLLRTHPLAVRALILAGVAALLTVVFWKLGARVISGPVAADQTVIVGLLPSTVAALRAGRIGADLPGLDPNLRPVNKSWRMLHGAIFEKLSQADPLVVAWDYFIRDCDPRFDELLVRGMRALGTRLVIGVGALDGDGEPLMCEQVRAAASAYGTLITASVKYTGEEYNVAYGLVRGLGAPIPTLAVRAFAATRFPDCDVVLHLDRADRYLDLRYRKRDHAPGEALWQSRVDVLPLHEVRRVDDIPNRFRDMQIGDRVPQARIPARPVDEWNERIIPYEDVLGADVEQLRAWFDRKAVMIGQLIAPFDQYKTGRGELVFGSEVHAEALDALLAGVHGSRYWRTRLLARNVIWCVAAGLLISVLPRRRWRSLRATACVCVLLFAVGVVLAMAAALRITEHMFLEGAIALSGLLSAGSLAFWAKAASERQYQLAPAAVTLDSAGSLLPSTILAEAQDSATPSASDANGSPTQRSGDGRAADSNDAIR